MSDLVYPTLPGLTFDSVRSPIWRTNVQTALSGVETAIAYMLYPRFKFTLIYEFLRDIGAPASGTLTNSEIKALVGFFNQVQGRYDTFLFTDPEFNSVTTMPFGTGDGSTVLYPITAIYENSGGPGQPELIQNFNGTPTFYDNGSLISSSDYTLGPTTSINAGYIQFDTAPVTGHALTWSGNFYYRCRFDEDTYEFTKIMKQLWELKKVSFTSVLL